MSADSSFTILVCDDDEDLLFLASSFLSKKNFNVIKATTGDEALDIYEKQQSDIKAVILDNTFKNSNLQGKDILIALKNINPYCKVLISSGYPENYFQENYPPEAFSLIDGFIDKNYSSPSFITKLQDYLNKWQG